MWLDLAESQRVDGSSASSSAFTFALAFRLSILPILKSFFLEFGELLPAGFDLVPSLTTVRTGWPWAAISKAQGMLRPSCWSIRVRARRP